MSGRALLLPAGRLDGLIGALRAAGYRTIGPTLAEHAIVLGDLRSADDLPVGWTAFQDAGTYRLAEREDRAMFGFACGPDSWKSWLHPPHQRLWSATRQDGAIRYDDAPPPEPPMALIGVRACDLAAIRTLDRVLGGVGHDDGYVARRERAFVVVVECAEPGGTCFCASQGTGPEPGEGFDLAMVELPGPPHRFILRIGSGRGEALVAGLALDEASDEDASAVREQRERARAAMGRAMPQADVARLLRENPEHPRWEEVAERCLACGNCTNACPTCFCTHVGDTTDLMGTRTVRERRWDSCFSADFSYLGEGPVRASTASRYRQWMTHKLSSWHEQFGSSGCVGCGRCITWCPVGIDITEEVAAIAASDGARTGTEADA